jgi:hypothetical protein
MSVKLNLKRKKERTYIEGIEEQVAEENIWT